MWWAALGAAIALVAAPTHAIPNRGRNFASPDWSYYHRTDEIFTLINSYAKQCPALEVSRVSDSETPPYTVVDTMICTATDTSVEPEHKVPMLVVFGEHARELISSEIALRLVAMLCSPALEARGGWILADVDAVGGVEHLNELSKLHRKAMDGLAHYGMSTAQVGTLLKRLLFKFVPVENLIGRRMVESSGTSKLCHRMNGRSVDINRNYDNHFGVHAKEYLPSEEYEGTRAFSEPETRITHAVAAALKPMVFVSVHSGIRELYPLMITRGWSFCLLRSARFLPHNCD